jgi:folate-binding protein YgfZ
MAAEGDFDREYRAALEGALVLDRRHLVTLRVRGKDRESFLQNMLTNDVRGLSPAKGRHSAFLTNKGKLIADFLVLREEDAFLLRVERDRAEPLRKALDRYIISEDVTLQSLSDVERILSVEGPEASGLLAALTTEARTEIDALEDLQSLHSIVAQRRELTPRFDLSLRSELAEELLERAVEMGAVRGGARVLETRRIEASRPLFGVDMDESHFPLEASLDEAVSFQKGCYIGQEYVARLAHRGHLNRKLSGLILAGSQAPSRGTAVLRDGEEVGVLTSAAFSPAMSRTIAFAYLKRGHWEPGTELRVGDEAATVSSLPFRLPGP